MVSEPVIASDNEGFLISAGSLFLRENFMQVKGASSVLGKLSEQKTKFMAWGSYPRNSFFNVEYVFENFSPPRNDDDAKGVQELADPRYVSINHGDERVPVSLRDRGLCVNVGASGRGCRNRAAKHESCMNYRGKQRRRTTLGAKKQSSGTGQQKNPLQ